MRDMLCCRYITSLPENAEEGTRLRFEGGLDTVEDLDKVNKTYVHKDYVINHKVLKLIRQSCSQYKVIANIIGEFFAH